MRIFLIAIMLAGNSWLPQLPPSEPKDPARFNPPGQKVYVNEYRPLCPKPLYPFGPRPIIRYDGANETRVDVYTGEKFINDRNDNR